MQFKNPSDKQGQSEMSSLAFPWQSKSSVLFLIYYTS